jgi:hypothetical protein
VQWSFARPPQHRYPQYRHPWGGERCEDVGSFVAVQLPWFLNPPTGSNDEVASVLDNVATISAARVTAIRNDKIPFVYGEGLN